MSELKVVTQSQPPSTDLKVRTLDDVLKFSDLLARSKLIPTHLQGKPSDVAIILMKGNELNLAPLQAIDSIDVIQGKPSLKPEAQLALIYSAFPQAVINIEQDPVKQTVRVSAVRPGNPTPQVFVWDMARARQMGLDQKDNYKKQPLVMLKWRAIGEMARTVFPDVSRGLFNNVEAEDFAVESGTDKASRMAQALAEERPQPKTVEATVEPAPLSPQAERAKAEVEKVNAILQIKPVESEHEGAAVTAEPPVQGGFDAFTGAIDDDADPVVKIGSTPGQKRMSQYKLDDLKKAAATIKARAVKTGAEVDFLKDFEFFLAHRPNSDVVL